MRAALPPLTFMVPMAALPAALALLAGCGHPASLDECEVIFQRTVEIELRGQNITDPKIIEDRKATVRAARGKDLIDRCVGRRITDRAVACVRTASTSDEVDRCLR